MEFLAGNFAFGAIKIILFLLIIVAAFFAIKEGNNLVRGILDYTKNEGSQNVIEVFWVKVVKFVVPVIGAILFISLLSFQGVKIKASDQDNSQPPEITQERVNNGEGLGIIPVEKMPSENMERAQKDLDKTKEEVDIEIPEDEEED